jgi:glycosyltransferase involved in cell wall biosynthesis
MRIVQITTDSRVHFGEHQRAEPYFGTAPAGLLDGFRDLGEHEIHVISCSPVPMAVPDKLADNIWFHQPVVGPWGWGRSFFSGCIRKVRTVLREVQPDIVHGQGTERDCAMDAVFSGRPNVLTIHGNMRVHAKRPEHAGMPYYKIAAALERLCLKRTGGVVAISTYTQDLVSDLAKRVWLLPNAVDARFFNVQPLGSAIPRALVVGSLNERKNPNGLIRACETLLRDGKLTLAFAGTGTPGSAYLEEFESLARTIPGIETLGFIGRDALAGEMSRSNLLLLPTFEDNCPMVVLEAMAAGLPVAASRVGGVPDLVREETDGLLFDPTVPQNITNCVERLLDNAGLRSRLGSAGRSKALKEYHPRVIAERHIEIYREVLGRS